MSLFDNASLVVTPNGYKEDKLYAIKPTDGSGDLVVTRATTATRVNSAGLVEAAPYNLLTNSEGNLATYGTALGNVSNASTSINGFSNSIQVGNNSVSTNVYKRTFTPTIGVQYTMSIFVQMDDNSLPILGLNTTSGDFSLIINNTLATLNPTIQKIGVSNVYKVSATYTAISTSTVFGVSKATTQSSKPFKFTGIQLVIGTSAKDYFPTTDRLDVPRLDYTGSTCPSILVEPQRTNLAKYSEDFSNALWTKTRATVTSNATTAPDGTLTADKLILSVDNNTHYIQQAGVSVTAQIYSATIYAKKAEYDTVRILLGNYWSPTPNATFNLTTKSILSTTSATAKITELTNGWFKLDITATLNATAGSNAQFLVYAGNNGNVSLSGDGTSGVYIWGAQIEAGSNSTSYIPTVAANVTRNADVISKTGVSSLIGQTEGTIYAEINVSKLLGTASRYIFHLSDGTANNRIYMAFSGSSSNVLRARIFSGGTLQCSIDTSTITSTGTYKLALAYKNNDIVFYLNGTQVGVDTTATIPTCSRVDLGNNYAGASQFNDRINNANIWKTRLTNDELATLTTI